MAERRNFYLFFPSDVNLDDEKRMVNWVAREYEYIWPETLTIARDEAEGNSVYKLVISVEKVS